MEHRFAGPSYTIGIEEELMILDGRSYELCNAIESLLGDAPAGQIKPELMESVLEIATEPCPDLLVAGGQLRDLRRLVRSRADALGLAIGSAGTHPRARWEQQRIVERPRYQDLLDALAFVARQELIFGMHVHVGLDDADKAIQVTNGLRAHVPVLVALSANSPFWRSDRTGLASTRVPIFRAFPRVGIPPVYRDWADYARRVSFMVSSGLIEDYTFLWYDVRPHPNLGTVEVRAMDSQTRLEHTLALAALVQAMVRELAEGFDAGEVIPDYPPEILDENKWLAARHGLGAEFVDLDSGERVGAVALSRALLARLREHAQDLGCEGELEGIEDLLALDNGAARQTRAWEAGGDLRAVLGEIVAGTGA